MPHTVSRQLTAEARVRFRATPGEVCGRRGTGARFPPSTSDNAPHSFSSTQALPGNTAALSRRLDPLRKAQPTHSSAHRVLTCY